MARDHRGRGGPAVSRRSVLRGLAAAGAAVPLWAAKPSLGGARFDVTFVFTSDVHACRLANGPNPACVARGKTQRALERHVAGINRVHLHRWPDVIGNAPTGLHGAGQPIAQPHGLVVGGDITDHAGGTAEHPGRPLSQPGQAYVLPRDSRQLMEFHEFYRQSLSGLRFPVYVGLGNHDLDRDGPADAFGWYRENMRNYVKFVHMPRPDYDPLVPVTNYDPASDCYSWDWGHLHLAQAHRYPGDTTKGAIDSLPWLERDLATYAGDGRPVIVFQHYGWDPFSIERWDPDAVTF